MRLLGRKGHRDKRGNIFMFTLKMENDDDMWNLYNFVDKGDFVQGKITRKVSLEGAIGSERKTMTIVLRVEEIEYDPDSNIIRIKGKNVSENKFIQVGQFQSMEVNTSTVLTLIKKHWDEIYEERLKKATDPGFFSDLAVVLMEEGISHLFLVAKNATYLKSKIEHHLPKKKTRAVVHDKFAKAQSAFFTKILNALIKYVNFDVIKSIIIASPGYTKNEFFDFLNHELEQNKYPELKNRKDMFILEHVTSGFKHSLKELLTNKSVQQKISQSSAVSEAKVLEDFNETLRKDPDRAAYGKAWVEAAVEQRAVNVLLISDKIMKTRSYAERDKYVKLTKAVENTGGTVVFFSSMHPTGEALNDLTGIAAILKFPVPDPAEGQEEEEETKAEEEEEEKADSEEPEEEELNKMFSGLSVEESEEAGEYKKAAEVPLEEEKAVRKKSAGKALKKVEEESETKAERKKSKAKMMEEEEHEESEEEKEEPEKENPHEMQKKAKEQKEKEKKERDEKRKLEQVRVPKKEKTKKTKQERNVKRDLKSSEDIE